MNPNPQKKSSNLDYLQEPHSHDWHIWLGNENIFQARFEINHKQSIFLTHFLLTKVFFQNPSSPFEGQEMMIMS